MTWQFLLSISGYIGAAGVLLYLAMLKYVSMCRVEPGKGIRIVKMLALTMVVTPMCLRLYLTQGMILYLGIILCSCGLFMKYRSWLGL